MKKISHCDRIPAALLLRGRQLGDKLRGQNVGIPASNEGGQAGREQRQQIGGECT
jgi:hypothetical protein